MPLKSALISPSLNKVKVRDAKDCLMGRKASESQEMSRKVTIKEHGAPPASQNRAKSAIQNNKRSSAVKGKQVKITADPVHNQVLTSAPG